MPAPSAGSGAPSRSPRSFPRLTVLESVLLAVQGRIARASRSCVRTASFPHLRGRALAPPGGVGSRRPAGHAHAGYLSYGEQRQVELILALAARPRVLLLDEPTAGLSPAETAAVAATIRRFPRDLTVLFIEHDMDVALDLADRVMVLHQGRVLAAGSPEEIRRDPRVAEIYLGVEPCLSSTTSTSPTASRRSSRACRSAWARARWWRCSGATASARPP